MLTTYIIEEKLMSEMRELLIEAINEHAGIEIYDARISELRDKLMDEQLKRDTGYTAEKWAFDDKVTGVFDDMLKRSIPEYETMRAACTALACRYAKPGTFVTDLGCSRGEALAPIVDRLGAVNSYIGCEVSPPMLQAARERFRGMISAGVVSIKDMDLRRDYPNVPTSVTLAVLTLQFTPIEYRSAILRKAFQATTKGGAFILVEKVLGSTAELDGAMVDEYYKLKEKNGYTSDEIQRKKLALEGVLVPVSARWNEELLERAGYRSVECFWRWMNFAGWIGVKE